MNIPLGIDTAKVDQLKVFLSAPERPQDTLNLNELKGFLFAIACSPELVQVSDWMPLIFANEEANFRDADEADRITQAIMALYNQVNQEVTSGDVHLPPSCQPVVGALNNFSAEAPIAEWSSGFLHGHACLEDLWDEYVTEELDEEVGSCLMVLSFFSDRNLADAYYREAFSGEHTFEQLAEEVLDIFEGAMASYAHIGCSIYEALMEQAADECEFAEGITLEADDPCPCDSGQHFKNCCGGPKTMH